MISTVDLGALRAFVMVADALSFTRAAEALGVTPSALSQTIRALEHRMETQLLVRTTRRVALTGAGRSLCERARPAVEELGGALDSLRKPCAGLTGTVRVHAFRAACDLFLAPVLARFAEAYPNVVLDVTLDDAPIDPVAGGFDVVIRLGEVIERDLVAVRLGPDIRQVVVASPAYLHAYGPPLTPADLAAHRCIRWRWPGQDNPYAWEFCDEGRWFKVAVNGPLIVNSRELGLRAAIEGVGIAFPSETMAAAPIAEGRLVPLLERWSAPFPGFFLCYPRQRHMPAAVRALIDLVRSR